MKTLLSATLLILAFVTIIPVRAESVEEAAAGKSGTVQSETDLLLEQAQSFLESPDDASDTGAEAVTDNAASAVVESPEPDTDTVGGDTDVVNTESLVLVEQEATGEVVPKDMLLVLDNSGSMKKNDPQFLTSQAVREFIGGLDEATRLGVIIFDQEVHIAVPFTEVTRENSATLLSSLDRINYKGLYTDSPAAIERAIYELKNNGRDDAEKFIVFMTDGIVDTGNPDVDLEKTRWLKDDLAADAADSGITIFGIAFTENADFQLIQSLAQKTDGDYYRVLQAEDLTRYFDKIVTQINTPPEPEPAPQPVPVTPPEPAPAPAPVVQEPPPPPPAPVIIEVPVERDTSEEDISNMVMIVAISAVLIALIAILILLMRRRGGPEREAPAQEAFINDQNGYTDHATYKLGSKPTMLGRVAGKDTEHLNYIVIPQTTIGRRHALIEYKDFAFWIIDQGSINGTFVNDKLISSETRLKHGDRIRLHKYELEFTIPELAEDGMTVISNTVFAGDESPAASTEDATVARAATTDAPAPEVDLEEPEFDLDFDITDGAGGKEPEPGGSEDVTAIRGADADATEEPDSEPEELDASDETIMLNDDDDIMGEDESAFDDDDATIRRKIEDKDSPEQFVETAEFNIKDLDEKK